MHNGSAVVAIALMASGKVFAMSKAQARPAMTARLRRRTSTRINRASANIEPSCYPVYFPTSLRGALATKQSILSSCCKMDCFAEPVIGRRFAPIRWLAMTAACLSLALLERLARCGIGLLRLAPVAAADDGAVDHEVVAVDEA